MRNERVNWWKPIKSSLWNHIKGPRAKMLLFRGGPSGLAFQQRFWRLTSTRLWWEFFMIFRRPTFPLCFPEHTKTGLTTSKIFIVLWGGHIMKIAKKVTQVQFVFFFFQCMFIFTYPRDQEIFLAMAIYKLSAFWYFRVKFITLKFGFFIWGNSFWFLI